MPAFNDFLKSKLRQPPSKARSTTPRLPRQENEWQIKRRWLFVGLFAVSSLLVLSLTCNLVLRMMLQSSRWERNQAAGEVGKLDGGKFGKLKPRDLKIAAENDLQTDYNLIGALDSQITELSGKIDNLGRKLHSVREEIHMLNPSSNKNESAPESSRTVSKDKSPSLPSGPFGP